MDFLTDPRVLFVAGAVFLVSLFFKWRIVAITIFAVAALVIVARYSRLAEGRTSMDQNLLVFAVGSFLVIVVVIYFLFIRGD
jgi:positive regulator of sigma E activity